MFRFSLAALLAIVTMAAVGCAALVEATDVWRQATLTLTVLILLTAALVALVGRGQRGAAVGFALFGWSYLVLAFVSGLGLRDDLLTDKSITWLFEAIHQDVVASRDDDDGIRR